MNDQQMRDHVDGVLAEIERRLQRRRRSKLAMAGSAAGLALALDACFKTLYGVEYGAPVYGIEVDAGDAGAVDATADDGAGFEAGTLYGVQCDGGVGEVGPVIYGIGF
ncbi:MAG: hypothetical protein JXR83_22095 [Deltaproteobacteria bacterium]|nr:hypothetical protein [Deltaproteobacteria bacterium]